MRSDDETSFRAVTRQLGVGSGRCIGELERNLSIDTLDVLQMVFNVLQAKNWLLGGYLNLRREDRVAVVPCWF